MVRQKKNRSPLLCQFLFVPARCDSLFIDPMQSPIKVTMLRCEVRGGAASPEPCPGTAAATAQQRGSAAGGNCEPQGGGAELLAAADGREID
jgi:hypothetical protein